jgi:hypothetical protein
MVSLRAGLEKRPHCPNSNDQAAETPWKASFRPACAKRAFNAHISGNPFVIFALLGEPGKDSNPVNAFHVARQN